MKLILNLFFLILPVLGFCQNNGVKFPAGPGSGSDNQNLSWDNPTLAIERGNSVNLSNLAGSGGGLSWAYNSSDTSKLWMDTINWKCQGYILKIHVGAGQWQPVRFYNPISNRWARDSQIVFFTSGQSNMNQNNQGTVQDSAVVYWNHLTGNQSLTTYSGLGTELAGELARHSGSNVIHLHINKGATDAQQWFVDSVMFDSIINYILPLGCPVTDFAWCQGENNSAEALHYDSIFYRIREPLIDSGVIDRKAKTVIFALKNKTNNVGFNNTIRAYSTRYPDPYIGGVLYTHTLGVDPENVHWTDTEKDSLAVFAFGVWAQLPRPVISEVLYNDGEQNITTVKLPNLTLTSAYNIIINSKLDDIPISSGQKNSLAIFGGQNLTTGSDNIFWGDGAGKGVTGGNNNIDLGEGNCPNCADRSNQIVYGKTNLTGTVSGSRNGDRIFGNDNFVGTTHSKLGAIGDNAVSDESNQFVFSGWNSIKLGTVKFASDITPTTGQTFRYHSSGEMRPDSRAYAQINRTSATSWATTGGSWSHIQASTGWASGFLQDFTRTDSTLQYTGAITKIFNASCQFTANSDINAVDIWLTIADNNTRLTTVQSQTHLESSLRQYHISTSGQIELSQNETFEARVLTTSSVNLTVSNFNCSLYQTD